MKTETSAGVIIYRRTSDGPRFLILYQGGRYWNFPKGKLNGESNFNAALREVREETGLTNSDLRFRDWFRVHDKFVYTRDKQKILKTVTYYLAETQNQKIRIKLMPEEYDGEKHYGYGWFLYRDALRMLIHQNLRANLKKAYEIITKKSNQQNRNKNNQKKSFNHTKSNSTGI